MSLYKQVPAERLSGCGFLKSPRDFKSVDSVESVRNKKAHTDGTDDTDGTPRAACGMGCPTGKNRTNRPKSNMNEVECRGKKTKI